MPKIKSTPLILVLALAAISLLSSCVDLIRPGEAAYLRGVQLYQKKQYGKAKDAFLEAAVAVLAVESGAYPTNSPMTQIICRDSVAKSQFCRDFVAKTGKSVEILKLSPFRIL